MATAEAAAASLGPRYAPDDPTLPPPWKGLIDGSTGVLYYWNPETNVTQYERPAPPPAQPPPEVHSQSQAPVQPHSSHMQPTGHQQGQQFPHQQALQPVQVNSQHIRPQMMQYGGQQAPSQLGPQLPNAQTYQGASAGNPQGYMYPQQQTQYMPYQQNPTTPQAHHQTSQQQNHQVAPGQQFPHQQDSMAGFPPRDDADGKSGKQAGHSPLRVQLSGPSGSSSSQSFPARTSPTQAPRMSVPPGQYGGSSINLQQSASPFPHGGMDSLQPQNGPSFQSHMGPGMVRGQQPNAPPFGQKMSFDEGPPGRPGNDFYFNPAKDSHGMVPPQPKLAPIPMTRNNQEMAQMRMGEVRPQSVRPNVAGGINTATGPPMHEPYGRAAGGPPIPNNSFMRPPSGIMGPSDINTMHLSAAEIYRKTHEVSATGDNVPAPFMTFEATGFPPEILREIHVAGFSTPTPIQAQTWPIALQGRDIVAIAKTGSGKTLGYLMPAFMHLRRLQNNPLRGPTVLVLAPTRELATQIQDEAIKFGRSSRVTCTCLYGGASKGPQLKELERGADIVVATPGRLNDILESKRIDFRQISLLVLDEADRMLDMGFEPQIRKIVNEIPPRRQTLMYTATWPKEVMKIANDLLADPVQVNIGSVNELAANKAITQFVEVIHPMEKQRRLEQILRSEEPGSKIIIFCSTKKMCDQLARTIGRNFGAAAIHGDKNQGERDWVLNQFRSGKTPILVATDVAARGLDIRDIRVVINYDFPTGVEDYVHRIGRTGRAGATGVAYTFFSEQDWKHAADLVKLLEGANQHVPPEVRDMSLRGGPNFGRDRGGMNRFDSGDGDGGGRWQPGGRGGMRDVGFGGRGMVRDGGFGWHGGMRDGGFGGRGGGMRDGGFDGRGGRDGGFDGRGGRDGGFDGRGGRDGGFGGRGGRDGGFGGGRGGMRDGGFGGRGGRDGGFGGGRGGFDRNDRFSMDGRGRGRGRGFGRFDNRRDGGDRSRGRSYSPSPDRVRTWGSRSRSRSRGRSRSRSYSSRSRSRSWSRSRSRSYSPRRSRSRSRSPRYDRREGRPPRISKFDQMEPSAPNAGAVAPPPTLAAGTPQGNGFSGAVPFDASKFGSEALP